MKDLTHYFVSPPKICENVTSMESDNESSISTTTVTTTGKNETTIMKNKNSRKKNGHDNVGKVFPKDVVEKTPTEKRTRVKIRISVTSDKKSKNRRCDIIENGDDVVDKTPSPFNKMNSTIPNRDDKQSPRDQSHNAFKVLMNRNKPTNTPCSSTINDSVISEETHRKYKKKVSSNKEKLLKLSDQKGEYSKRKHVEIEETETIENKLQKKARLLNIEDTPEQESKGKDQFINQKKDAQKTLSKLWNGTLVDVEQENNNVKKKKKHKSKTKDIANENEKGNSLTPQSQNSNTSLGKERVTPTRNKAKWTMRVQLHSQSDDDKEDTGKVSDDDNDCLFTPKSKRKLKKTKTRINSSEEDKDTKKVAKNATSVKPHPSETKSDLTSNHEVPKRTSKKNKNDEKDCEPEVVIDVQKNTNTSIMIDDNDAPKILQDVKLAPLFVKRFKPNPATLEARRSFLQSGIPENLKKLVTSELKSASNDSGLCAMPFPMISHVTQTEITESVREKNYETSWKVKSEQNQTICDFVVDANQFKSLSKAQEHISDKTDTEKFVRIERENFETVLKDIESRCTDTRTIWERVSSTALNPGLRKSPKKRTKKLKLQKKVGTVQDSNPDSLNPTWTCKYKPINSVEVVGNETAIIKLRNWLNGWRIPSNKEDCSSGEEFYSSDCSISSCYENNQVAVLLGPHGSGKSASVYAIAEELGYRVLEVNASSRRTGKKILSDFQEATKSHRVKRDQGSLMLTKKKPLEKKVPQNSLILIEDVDLIFEEDEGLISATCHLAANTRRPIVMTCKETCSHLYKMAPRLQLIYFQAASGSRVSALLELITLAESGYRLSKSCLDTLLRNGDLRQSLLQLQYILLSGPPSISQLGLKTSLTLWEDMQPLIYKPAIKYSKKLKKESTDTAEQEKNLMNTISIKLENISLITSLTDIENPVSPPWNKKLIPSLSLFEDFKPYSNSDDLSYEIAEWLQNISLKSDQTNSNSRDSQTEIKRNVKLGIDLALSQAVPSTLEHRSKAIDYLPIIRSMCRSEQNRATINPKRGNRFYNYLHSLNLASASSNILAAAGSVFQDKFA